MTLGSIDLFIGIPLVLDHVWSLVFLRMYSCCFSLNHYFDRNPCPQGLLKGILKQAHRYDIACMMLAFTVFWAYISFFSISSSTVPTYLRKPFGIIYEKNLMAP